MENSYKRRDGIFLEIERVEFPLIKKPVRYRWIYIIKYKANDTI
jgi:hypothetical protein